MKKGHKPHSLEGITHHLSDWRIVHYTCNAPDLETCRRNGIVPIGDRLGCADPREVLLIPQDVIEKAIRRTLNLDN